jgi:hypothetical protein
MPGRYEIAEPDGGDGEGGARGETAEVDGSDATDEGGSDGGDQLSEPVRQARAPWHFKFIVVGSVIYLGYRLYQGIYWLAHHV